MSTIKQQPYSKQYHPPTGGLLNLRTFPMEQVRATESPSPHRAYSEGSGLSIHQCILIPKRQLRKPRLGEGFPEGGRQGPSRSPGLRKGRTHIRTMPGVYYGRWQWVRNHKWYHGYLSMQPYNSGKLIKRFRRKICGLTPTAPAVSTSFRCSW